MQRQITTEEIVGQGLDQLKASVYLRMPGSVITYYPATQTADVQPMVNDPRTNLDTDAVAFETWPVLQGVRVAWPRFGNFTLCGPLNQYDAVVLEAFDLDPTTVWTQGRSGNPVNPADVRRLSGNYWSARPTDMSGPIKSAQAAAAAFLLGLDNDTAQILISSGLIQLGASASNFVALANLVATELGKVKSALAGLEVTVPSGGGTNIAVTSTSPYSTVGNVAATVVKAQ
jgi:hypothetical protein